jgi:uncharacterized BrkB/YihY/UPF0761 family membrane protein
VATVLWWLVSLLLAPTRPKAATWRNLRSLTGVMALLLWANLTGIALFLGVAFTAQLEPHESRNPGRPRLTSSCWRSGPTPISTSRT